MTDVHATEGSRAVARLPTLLIGIGLGGFVDGIVIHQLLQWHHMVSDTDGHSTSTVAGLETNTFADGLFHAAAWICVLVGVALAIRAWRIGRPAARWPTQVGLLVIGWGAFNIVEGLVDHHILEIHHVRDDLGGPLSWDLGFLGISALLVLAGWALIRIDRPRSR